MQPASHAERPPPTTSTFLAFAMSCVASGSSPEGSAWFGRALTEAAERHDKRRFGTAIALTARRIGKPDLILSEAERARIERLRPGLDLSDWSLDQLARVALVVAAFSTDPARFPDSLATFCNTAEVSELIAIYRGFPLYPDPLTLEPRAREAIRSGIRPIFEAMAHRNPYPAEVFGEDAWNQMILKALFIGSSLWPIQRLDERANPRLARMLLAYAQERWAAHRPVTPELWRCVALHAEEDAVAAMSRVMETGDERERLAIAVASRQAHGICFPFQQQLPALWKRIDAEHLDWPALV